MPLARLMSKLSKRDKANHRDGTEMGSTEMDCDRSPRFGVTAEIVQQQQGLRTRSLCSSSLSSASSADALLDMSSSKPAEHHHRSYAAPSAASSSFMIGALPSRSAAAAAAAASGATSHPVSLRVMRAKGKAALRGHTLGSAEQHCSLDRSMSVERQQGYAPFTVGSSSSSAQSPPYHRAATDPVSLWVATGSISNSQKLPQLLAARGIIPVADDDDEPLASPLSPGGAGAVEADPHCEWEDGVVAGWLDGIDPSELMHDEDELHQQKKQQQPQPQQHKRQQQQSPGLSGAQRTGSTASATMAAPEVVFSSLLYS